jgi:hypothetical protein
MTEKQEELIKALNNSSILLQLSMAKNKSIEAIKADLLRELFYACQDKNKVNPEFKSNSNDTLLGNGKWEKVNTVVNSQNINEENADEEEEDEWVEDENYLSEEEFLEDNQDGSD